MCHDRAWAERALCARLDPDTLFVEGAEQRTVRERCLDCPVRIRCLAEALQSGTNFGVWGGLTERERRALRRRYPNVQNWYEWLETSDEPVAQELRCDRPHRVLALARVG